VQEIEKFCHVNSMFFTFRVRELKYAIRIFKGTKGVTMTTKFRQKYVKIAHILVLYKIWKHFCMYISIFGVGEFKYAIRRFQGANVVAMATKRRQKNKIALILVLCKVWRHFLRVW